MELDEVLVPTTQEDPGFCKTRGSDFLTFAVTCNENDVTIGFSVDLLRTNAHPVPPLLLDLLESEVLETIYSLWTFLNGGGAFCGSIHLCKMVSYC